MKNIFSTYTKKLVFLFLRLSRVKKRIFVIIIDLLTCIFTVYFSYYLRTGELMASVNSYIWPIFLSVAIAFPIFFRSGMYLEIFRYSGGNALFAVAKSIGLYGLIYAFFVTFMGIPDVPRTIGIIQPLLLLIIIGASRIAIVIWLGDKNRYRIKNYSNHSRVMIYGAGQHGSRLASALANNDKIQLVGFIDDDYSLQGHYLDGVPIYSSEYLSDLIQSLEVNSILLAMPGISRKIRNQVIEKVKDLHVSVRTLPSIDLLAEGKINISDLRELELDDLLGRDPVSPDYVLLRSKINNKIVMVTGAGGSIGSELCRKIFNLSPSKLVLVEQNEFSLYTITQELEKILSHSKTIIVPLLVPLNSLDNISILISKWCPDIIYHAAAYKHVPLVENNPISGIINNVFGTLYLALAAQQAKVSNFVLVSSDKAVRPTSVMGASKRLSEMILQALAAETTTTTFCIVRFGNVLGSSGSVVPKFRKQIHEGGPVTLTHKDINRYFMTINEAAELVMQAGAMSRGGEVFVLDMGEPVKIYDLAVRMIELSGLNVKDSQNPDGDIEIQISGLRPGEKLYEELLIGDNPQPTSHSRIFKAHEDTIAWDILCNQLDEFKKILRLDDEELAKKYLKILVQNYFPER